MITVWFRYRAEGSKEGERLYEGFNKIAKRTLLPLFPINLLAIALAKEIIANGQFSKISILLVGRVGFELATT